MNKALLGLGIVLILIGLYKPNLTQFNAPVCSSIENYITEPPTDENLKSKCDLVVESFVNGGSDRKQDAKKLSSLFYDIANLIEIDVEEVVKNTEEIRQVNALAGPMLKLNIKDKYPNLSVNTNNVVVSCVGDDNVLLDKNLRVKAVEAFRALSWACYEGSK
jgi:hypothetical protein